MTRHLKLVRSCGQTSAPARPKSCPNILPAPQPPHRRSRAARAGMQARLAPSAPDLRVADPYRFRAGFCEAWRAFLAENFRTIEAVAVHYDVRFQTASNWWGALHRPSGNIVAQAALEMPASFRRHMAGLV